MKVVLKIEKLFSHFGPKAESNIAPWWTQNWKFTRCYATSLHIWVLGNIDKL